MKHIPSGIEASSSERCQHHNKRVARGVLEARVAAFVKNTSQSSLNSNRRGQIGSGERGDKVRTYREQDDLVSDNRTGKRARLSSVVKGMLELLW